MTKMPSLAHFRPDLKMLGYRRRTFYWGPFLVGLGVAYFLSAVAQTREVYLSLLEGLYLGQPGQILQAIVGTALLILLCLLLHSWQRMLGTAALDRIYPEHADVFIDARLFRWQRSLSRISAILPVLGLIAGLGRTTFEAAAAGTNLEEVLEFFGGANWRSEFKEFETTTNVLPFYAEYGYIGLFVLGTLAGLVLYYGRAWVERLLGRSVRKIYNVIFVIAALVSITALFGPLVARESSVTVVQTLGPLATAVLFLISVTSALIGISYLLNRSRWPLGGFALLAGCAWFGLLTYRSLTPVPVRVAAIGDTRRAVANQPPPIHVDFERWLAERKATRGAQGGAANSEYPVFIVAAQGGGIYAAAATTAFLAAMQDVCPAFSQHVFAISAVSGGAVGSTLFNALQSGKPLSDEGCRGRAAVPVHVLTDRTRDIVRGDYLSPALSLIWPDVARKIITLGTIELDLEYDRSSALEHAFACAMYQPGTFCSGSDPGVLRMPFKSHWNPTTQAPALVLTSTWVETGYRAAFSPFKLNKISDGTIFAFPNGSATGSTDDFAAHGIVARSLRTDTLISAAMVSARFPGIVPAYVVGATHKDSGAKRKWNFVDGGYVDNSGATTAFEIYRALHQRIHDMSAEKLPIENVRLYLILMTDANTDPRLRDVDDGTSFSDTVAPVSALLNVRSQLTGRAVKRTIEETHALAVPGQSVVAAQLTGRTLVQDAQGNSRVSPVLTINLQQEVFNLPLGWKISGTTDDIVRLMLGRPELCGRRRPEKKAKNAALKVTISDNSCVKQTIMDLLSGQKPKERIAGG